jgi:hypothetical protein
VALIDADAYLVIQFVVSILALIVCVFAWQSRQWWWLPLLGAVAVLWNPVWPITIDGSIGLAAHYLAAGAFIAAGLLIKVRNVDDKNNRNPQGSRTGK